MAFGARRHRFTGTGWPGIGGALVAGLLLAAVSISPALALDVPFKFVIAGRQSFEGVGRLEGKHFTGDARDGSASLHLEGDIAHGELTVQATGNMMPGYGERNAVATGSVRPAAGKVQFSLEFSSSHGRISNELILDLPAAGSAGSTPLAAPAASPQPPLEPIGKNYVAVTEAKVREKPDPLSARVKTIGVGQTITVVGRLSGQNWYLVSENGSPIGYVIVQQLAPEPQPVAAAPAAPAPAADVGQTGGQADMASLGAGSSAGSAVDVPFRLVITGRENFEGVGKLEKRHFSGDAREGSASVHLEGDIRHGELTVQATGDMMPGYGVEHNLVATGSVRPAVGKVKLSLEFSSSHGRISNELFLDLPAEAPTSITASAGSATSTLLELQTIDQTYVAIVQANVRQKPDPLSARIKTIEAGQKITVVGRLKDGGWYLVAENGKPLGYVVIDQLVSESQYAAKTSAAPSTGAAAAASTAPIDISKLGYGHYAALVIGNDDYRNGLPRLGTAAGDARAVGEALRSKYGFDVAILINATRQQIFAAMTKLRVSLGGNDNLLIYYAGRGKYDEVGGQGYWLPVDADPQDPTNWLSNADVTTMMRAMRARHVMVVADSIYAGALTPENYKDAKDANYFGRIVAKKSRTVMTSGTSEPVVSGAAGHSMFAAAFIAALQQNTRIEDAQTLFAQVRDSVAHGASQTPQYDSIRSAGHDGGDFVFVRNP